MCGIAGFLSDPAHWPGADAARRVATGMADAIAHRGPDDVGLWLDEQGGLAFGFRRLSILDLSSTGHQPMESHCGRYTIVFNGEIYNHAALRKEAEEFGHPCWRGHSDTEIMLAHISKVGVEGALPRLSGMFAIAVWDRVERRLWLARDRIGEKPLYYGKCGGSFVFGSELKALRRHPAVGRELDPDAVAVFLRYGFLPDPLAIYRGMKKLLPGHLLCVRADESAEPRPYWNAVERLVACRHANFAGDENEALGEFRRRLRALMAERLVADVPVGAFLSGGIDSSTVVAAMMATGKRPVRSFTVGFEVEGFDESPWAEAVARHLGTDHTTIRLGEADLLEAARGLARIYDEPFADPSQIPTVLLCRETRRHVTVSMSGDGGDELFGGYSRYLAAARRKQRLKRTPAIARSLAACAADSLRDRRGRLTRHARRWLADRGRADADALYRDTLSRWRPEEGLYARGGRNEGSWDMALPPADQDLSDARRFMLRDTVTYLPGDLLVKMDRASMAFALEVRAPLLDHELVEFAWSLPDALTVAPGDKGLLRKALEAEVPARLLDRPKQGFVPPLAKWLGGGLRDWADGLLAPARVSGHGLYDTRLVWSRWREHISGRRSWTFPLWTVLMLEAWIEEWDRPPPKQVAYAA